VRLATTFASPAPVVAGNVPAENGTDLVSQWAAPRHAAERSRGAATEENSLLCTAGCVPRSSKLSQNVQAAQRERSRPWCRPRTLDAADGTCLLIAPEGPAIFAARRRTNRTDFGSSCTESTCHARGAPPARRVLRRRQGCHSPKFQWSME
jgi:hypothetical protein